MRSVTASLATILALGPLALAACGEKSEEGAEPGASEEATIVLDFQPNPVHAGLYVALDSGAFADRGLSITIREPGASTDAPKLLSAGRAEFAILDIHDLAIARERGFDLVAVAPIVQRPLASVIALEPDSVKDPGDLAGARIGVTGLPSDDAVLESILADGGVEAKEVDTVTIGFDAVASLAAGKLDAATGFWNSEAIQLDGLNVPTRVLRVDDYGAPRYPELVLATSAETIAEQPELVQAVVDAVSSGYEQVEAEPEAAIEVMLESVDGLDPEAQEAQMDALIDAGAFSPVGRFNRAALRAWARWDAEHGIVEKEPEVEETFDLG